MRYHTRSVKLKISHKTTSSTNITRRPHSFTDILVLDSVLFLVMTPPGGTLSKLWDFRLFLSWSKVFWLVPPLVVAVSERSIGLPRMLPASSDDTSCKKTFNSNQSFCFPFCTSWKIFLESMDTLSNKSMTISLLELSGFMIITFLCNQFHLLSTSSRYRSY